MHLVAQYLQRAREAEEHSAATKDPNLKKQWLEVANGYRNLAQTRFVLFPSESPSEEAEQTST